MNTNLQNEDYDTLGGFLLSQLDKIPVPGDTITYENMSFTVLTTRGLRITKVKVERAGTDATSSNSTQHSREQSGPLLLPSGKEDDKPNQQKNIEPPTETRPHYEIKEV